VENKSRACPNDRALKPVVKKRGLPWLRIITENNFISWFNADTREHNKLPVPPNVRTFLNMYDLGEVIDKDGNIHVNDLTYVLDPTKATTSAPKPHKVKTVTGVVKPPKEKKSASVETRKRLAAQASGIRRYGVKGYDARRNMLLKPEYREAVAA
jgi:hypothetical protein